MKENGLFIRSLTCFPFFFPVIQSKVAYEMFGWGIKAHSPSHIDAYAANRNLSYLWQFFTHIASLIFPSNFGSTEDRDKFWFPLTKGFRSI